MARINLDFAAPRGIHFELEDGRIGVVTNLFDCHGDPTMDPSRAVEIVVFVGLDCPEGAWLRAEVDPEEFVASHLPAGSA